VAARFTEGRVVRFLWHRRATVSLHTARQDAVHLSVLMRDLVPGKDWRWIMRLTAVPAHREAMASRRPPPPFDPGELVQAASEQLGTVPQGKVGLKEARALRDHALLVVAVVLKHRVSNLAGLHLGTTLRLFPTHARIEFSGAQTKTGAPIHAHLEGVGLAALRLYLEHARPVLLGARPDLGHVWLSAGGRALEAPGIRAVFGRRGMELLGRHLSPHMTRSTYATTMRTADPTSIRQVAAGLSHKSTKVTLKHYDRSGTQAADKAWKQVVQNGRKRR
jgi:integrase